MKHAGLTGLLLLVLAVPVAHADVTVRVEGATQTLVNTTVAQTGPDVTKAGATCSGASASGALDRAVAGDWTATAFGSDQFIDTIKGEAVPYTTENPKFWGFAHNNTFAQVGVCGYTPAPNDELLFFPACDNSTSAVPTGCFDGLPLDVTAPATATTGVPFTVTVRQFDDSKDPATVAPAQGASIGGATTGADGTARVTVTQAGTTTLVATKGKQVRDSATVVVSDPPAPGTSPTPAPVTPAPSVVPDTRTPFSKVTGITEQQVFRKRSRAPRELRATIDEDQGLASVTLGLTRKNGRRCTAFDDKRAAFKRVRCGAHPRFVIPTTADVSYLLPKRLGPGRYVLDVVATDRAGNEEKLARGTSRVVFTVR